MIEKFDITKYQIITKKIADELEDNKAFDVSIFNLESRTDITFQIIVATGRSSRHVTSLANKVIDVIRSDIPNGVTVEGMEEGQWVLIDIGGIIVHIFQQETRAKYRIEELCKKRITKTINN